MDLVNDALIAAFIAAHPGSADSFAFFIREMRGHRFASPHQLKQIFASADIVPPWTVFNIGGNKYRLVAQIDYRAGTVFIGHVMTHAEYSRNRWR